MLGSEPLPQRDEGMGVSKTMLLQWGLLTLIVEVVLVLDLELVLAIVKENKSEKSRIEATNKNRKASLISNHVLSHNKTKSEIKHRFLTNLNPRKESYSQIHTFRSPKIKAYIRHSWFDSTRTN